MLTRIKQCWVIKRTIRNLVKLHPKIRKWKKINQHKNQVKLSRVLLVKKIRTKKLVLLILKKWRKTNQHKNQEMLTRIQQWWVIKKTIKNLVRLLPKIRRWKTRRQQVNLNKKLKKQQTIRVLKINKQLKHQLMPNEIS